MAVSRAALLRRTALSPILRDLLAWSLLAVAALVALWPLGLTNRALAGIDAFTYFAPYWAYRMAELRAGHLPLWNPYLFLGVPFLANPQAAVLYPLHWPLSWLEPARALVWSALVHIWLAAGFTYTFARRSLHVGRPAAWLTAILFGLGGFTVARIENINQLNALAWLPASLWLLDEAANAFSWRQRLGWGTALTVVLALQLLAGHTQTAFVNMAGLTLYAVYPLLRWAVLRLWATRRQAAPGQTLAPTRSRNQSTTWMPSARKLLPLAAILPALLLCAAQLLPSVELNGLGARAAGLPFRQAASFSLRPQLLAQSLLPPFGGRLDETFGSEGYAEFVAYLGIAGPLIAAAGWLADLRSQRRRERDGDARATASNGAGPAGTLVLLAVAGLLLALGGYNPLYYLLWRFVPGFDLFRVPARWLALYSFGVAGLAGLGLDRWQVVWPDRARVPRATLRLSRAALPPGIAALGAIALLAASQRWPSWPTLAGWAAAVGAAILLLWAGRRQNLVRLAGTGLILLALAELWLSGRAMPFSQATSPFALNLRNAPAALLAATSEQPAAGRDRFLSMSDIEFDPGDLAELRALEADRLAPPAVERMVRAAKQMEVVAPNLSLLLKLPAIDGYDGGLLPIGRYAELQTLFLPPEKRLPDGRLREQLRQVPDGRLLDLTGVRFVVTDKQNDLWTEDVYYDLEQTVTLQPTDILTLDLSGYPAFSATGAGIVSYLANPAPSGQPVAEIDITDSNGGMRSFIFRAGFETAEGHGRAGHATIARPWPDWMGTTGRDYLARFDAPAPFTPRQITIRALPGAPAPFVLRGLTLVDRRTGAHMSVTVSPHGDFRRIHSGDVKIYERVGAPGRAWLVHGIEAVNDDEATLRRLAGQSFDPRSSVLVTGAVPSRSPAPASSDEQVTVEAYDPEQIVLRARVAAPGALVLADTFYPGWQATVDGESVPILRANLMFRAVLLGPGVHRVVFSYVPRAWRLGLAISLTALAVLLLTFVATYIRPWLFHRTLA